MFLHILHVLHVRVFVCVTVVWLRVWVIVLCCRLMAVEDELCDYSGV